MCDYREGELILAYSANDSYGQQLVEHIDVPDVVHVEDLRERLARSDLKSTVPLRAHLLRVPEGQEHWTITSLHAQYRRLASKGSQPPPTAPVMIVPNSYLSLEGFNQSVDYAAYKTTLGSSGGATGAGVTVAIVDSGTEAGGPTPTSKVTDLIVPNGTGDDSVSHGTAVANVINDIAPGAILEVVKITDTRRVIEWDGLAGLDAASSADVINLSMTFGNATRLCNVCGRQSISSRSIVFERIVELILQKPHEPIIVAAAGNQANQSLRYPARFANVVAVGAVDANGNRAAYSNYGALDAARQPHRNLFFAPGGDKAQPVGTTVAPLPQIDHFGTSLATAYASGVVAWARETRGSRAQTLADLRAAAIQLPNHVAADDGNGLIQGC